MTVLCLVEHEASEVIDASLRALSFARTLGESSGEAARGGARRGDLRSDPRSARGLWRLRGLRHRVGGARLLRSLGVGPSHRRAGIELAGHRRGRRRHRPGQRSDGSCRCAHRARDGGKLPQRVEICETTVHLSRQRWGGSLIEDAVVESLPLCSPSPSTRSCQSRRGCRLPLRSRYIALC